MIEYIEMKNGRTRKKAASKPKPIKTFSVLYRLKSGYAVVDQQKFSSREEAQKHLEELEARWFNSGCYGFMVVECVLYKSIEEEEKS